MSQPLSHCGQMSPQHVWVGGGLLALKQAHLLLFSFYFFPSFLLLLLLLPLLLLLALKQAHVTLLLFPLLQLLEPKQAHFLLILLLLLLALKQAPLLLLLLLLLLSCKVPTTFSGQVAKSRDSVDRRAAITLLLLLFLLYFHSSQHLIFSILLLGPTFKTVTWNILHLNFILWYPPLTYFHLHVFTASWFKQSPIYSIWRHQKPVLPNILPYHQFYLPPPKRVIVRQNADSYKHIPSQIINLFNLLDTNITLNLLHV